MHSSHQREIREILVAANSGEATPEQYQRLNDLIVNDPGAARYAAEMLDQQAALAWQGVPREPLHELHVVAQAASPRGAVTPASRSEGGATLAGRHRESGRGLAWPALSAGVAFVAGTLAASYFWSTLGGDGKAPAQAAVSPSGSAYEARLVRSTACLWDRSSTGSRAIGSWLTSGESLDLLEGLAGINLSWGSGGNASVSLEGPAAMMLSAEGMPALRFGKLTANISAQRRPFVLETPVGRLEVADYGSIGVSAFGNDAEIHVFDGSATVSSAWLDPTSRDAAPLRVEAGEAVRIHADGDGELVVERHPAEQAYFVAQVSMASDALIVTPKYVNAVKASKPIGYWRLERDEWPTIPNEMGSRYECHVNGSPGRTGGLGNQALEFGVNDKGANVLCSEVLDEAIGDSYSLELWLKPSHYHVGAVVSLVGDPETPTGVIPHGMLIEMGGTGLIPTAVHHPGRVRFLHRSPASNDREVGTSCYSESPYILRKWQHVVAVKDESTMRLYVNGIQVGEGHDTNKLPAGLRLLVGELYPSRGVRPFIGQLDELALYDRALTPTEILQHYQLIRPQSSGKPSI